MTFEEILDQAVAMLQRRGRIAYSALKRQFDLDDAYLEDLKDALLFAHPVVDEDGRGLVWTGETEAAPVTPSQPNQPEPYPVIQQAQPIQETSSPIAPHTLEAERRQLTVMFIDLVESTALAGELDPEDYRDVVRRYQRVCSEVISRYDGYIAQYLGDGLLVYFGFPQAHEDDAQRAVRTGLGIVEAIRSLNTGLEQEKGIKLAVRLGIHTGLVVVGEMGGEGRQEQLALGETPNVTARIQGLAEPDTLIVSETTYRLVQGFFDFDSLGEHVLRGVSQPIPVYRVLGDRGIQSRLDVASTRGLTPLVSREREVDLLLDRWGQAKDAQGQVVLLSGEAGIGKSRLVQVLKDQIVDEPHTRLECRSLPYFTNSALYPITDVLQRTLRFQTDDTPEQKLEKLAENLSQYRVSLEESVPLFGALLSLPVPEDRYPPLNLSSQRQRQKTLEAIVAILLELAERQPMLFILEDLHWTDPTTLEFLDLLIDQTPTASICALLTCRSEFQPSWSHRSYLTEVTVNRLSQPQIERMAQQVADGKRLPTEVIQQLVDKTDGVPLYVEEMTKAVLESGVLKETNGHYELVGSVASLAIPATLQDSLMARLDRLVTAKGVAQYASVIGRQFSYELLQAVSELDGATLQRELGRLVDAELVYQRGVISDATYFFKHALIQDTAYESLLRSTRQGYHRHIAEVLEERFPETAEAQPELLAHHFTEAGLHEQAVGYWQQAGRVAQERSAHEEAIVHFSKGLQGLMVLPETRERDDQQELTLCLDLGKSLTATKGWAAPETESIYVRAWDLCQQTGNMAWLASVLWGLSHVYVVRADFMKHREMGTRFFSLADQRSDAIPLMAAHWLTGQNLIHVGEYVTGLQHLKQAYARYEPQQQPTYITLFGVDVGVFALSYMSHVLWGLGYREQAMQRSREALTLAQDMHHPFSIALAQDYAAMLHQFCREPYAAQTQAEAAIALCMEQGYAYYLAWGRIIQNWALTKPGQEEGIAKMSQSLDALRATGGELRLPYYLALLAEACGKADQANEGLTLMSEALTVVEKTEERFWEAELHRLKGELLLQQSSDNAAEAETCFHQAMEVSRRQQAKSWELRAATSLAKLWQQQGKCQDAYDLLAPVYDWFTEGFDTVDLLEAKQLLDELAA
jgi:TOMM system kinase/cyclase fusion protein